MDLAYAEDGYRILVKQPGPHLIRGFFDGQTVQSLFVEADMTLRQPPHAPEAHAIACINGDVGYILIVVPEEGAYALARADFKKPAADWTVLVEGQSELVRGVGHMQRLRLECLGGGDGATRLTASLDGKDLDRAEDAEGFDSFSGMALWVGAPEPDTEVFVDNVLADEL